MAAVGAVVTQKIGGNAATATSYTLISSAFTAIAVPLVYPIVEPGMGICRNLHLYLCYSFHTFYNRKKYRNNL